MKKLSLILMLMLLSFFTMEANVTSANSSRRYPHVIDLESWDKSARSIVPNPIECYLKGNDIEIRFIEHPETPVTLQIKDARGNTVYQDMGVNGQQDTFKIEISHLQSGSYELYYSDEETTLKGSFDIE